MLFLVLGHVDAHQRLLVVEEKLGERAGQLGLADAGRPQEQEAAERAVGILQPGARAPDRVRDGVDGLVLADHALVEPLLHVNQLLDLALHQTADRNVRPLADDLGDVLLVDLFLQHPLTFLQLGEPRLRLADSLLELRDPSVLELGRLRVVAGALRLLDLEPSRLRSPPGASAPAGSLPSPAATASRGGRVPP